MMQTNILLSVFRKVTPSLVLLLLAGLTLPACDMFWNTAGLSARVGEVYLPYVTAVDYPEQVKAGEELKIVIHSTISALPGLAANPAIETGAMTRPTYAVQNHDYDKFVGLVLRERPPGMSDNLGYQSAYTCSLGVPLQTGTLRVLYGTPKRPEDGGRMYSYIVDSSIQYPPESDWIEYKEFTIEVVAADQT